MKRLLLIFSFVLASCTFTFSQQQYTVDGESYSLQTEVDGTIELLWNVIDDEYRYFIKKGNDIAELKNTRTDSGYSEEYKDVLRLFTRDSQGDVDKTKLTLASLRNYFRSYNKRVDASYDDSTENIDLKLRLGPFVGVSNAIFTQNTENATLFTAGADLELVDEVKLRRHSVVLRFKQTFENSDFTYNASQFSLNYRFKFIKSETVDVFVNGKFVAYTYSERDFEVTTTVDGMTTTFIQSASGGDLNVPGTFGIGADIQLGSGQLFITYNDIVGVGVDSNGEFPIDFSVGYKFGL
ncbi:hypothetical protein J1N09_01880 [Aureitalea sp. L0-47]|uniref:hypothetical protein n=1 Tax=Aureitalea sp. L0-47 TaxID=2816962 RepID=UPI00223730C6|nr:hypothetical protein [Aureitalea sp. L0-47]MCW5518571.1 hypothetical protein [Aureitalea sp. L0-47]